MIFRVPDSSGRANIGQQDCNFANFARKFILPPTVQPKELFEILVRENSRMLTTYLRAAGCDDALLDDVWQEAMIVAWRRLDEFDRTKPFGPWLRGIAARTLMASRRSASRFVLTDDVDD